MCTIEVQPFNADRFAQLIATESKNPEYVILQKSHLQYFKEYLQELQVLTIVIERKYVDRDYLEDYAAYYVRSFSRYKRFCTRLHFFKSRFNKKEFEEYIINIPDVPFKTDFQPLYAGFMVLKRLPQTVIGRTCLANYIDLPERCFPIVHKYTTHLLGKEFVVDSLAYQEQDHMVAACASSALWSAFHSTGNLFHHSILSPVEITRAASQNYPYRSIPNDGLNSEQMAFAIRKVGLEPLFIKELGKVATFKQIVYGYMMANIPLILGLEIFKDGNYIGRHAVTISGFRKGGNTFDHDFPFRSVSTSIQKLYIHDDQIGPFARTEFDDKGQLKIVKKYLDGTQVELIGKPEILIIPIYHKIRISIDIISMFIGLLNSFIIYTDAKLFHGQSNIDWDIYLTTSHSIKSEVSRLELPSDVKLRFLQQGFPKYIWLAKAIHAKGQVLFLFDATDLEYGTLCNYVLSYPGELEDFFKTLFTKINFEKLKNTAHRRIFEKIATLFR